MELLRARKGSGGKSGQRGPCRNVQRPLAAPDVRCRRLRATRHLRDIQKFQAGQPRQYVPPEQARGVEHIGIGLVGTGSTTTAPPTSTQGTIGPTSGGVEWICSDGSGSGGNTSAAIAAVQDGQGNWQCQSDLFGNLCSVEVGGAFYCTTDDANGTDVGGPPYYAPTIGSFTVDGKPGSYYGVYCTEPGEDALDATP